MLPKAKIKLKKGKLKAMVKYPAVGKAEIEIINIEETSKLKALIKIPFLLKAKLFGLLKLKKEEKDEKGKG